MCTYSAEKINSEDKYGLSQYDCILLNYDFTEHYQNLYVDNYCGIIVSLNNECST